MPGGAHTTWPYAGEFRRLASLMLLLKGALPGYFGITADSAGMPPMPTCISAFDDDDVDIRYFDYDYRCFRVYFDAIS